MLPTVDTEGPSGVADRVNRLDHRWRPRLGGKVGCPEVTPPYVLRSLRPISVPPRHLRSTSFLPTSLYRGCGRSTVLPNLTPTGRPLVHSSGEGRSLDSLLLFFLPPRHLPMKRSKGSNQTPPWVGAAVWSSRTFESRTGPRRAVGWLSWRVWSGMHVQ